MSNVYTFTCKSCGKEYKRYSYAVYGGDETRCAKCNKDIPFDRGEGSVDADEMDKAFK